MKTKRGSRTTAHGLALALLLAGCSLVLPSDSANQLDLFYRLEQASDKGETTQVASWLVDGRVKLHRAFVRFSGWLRLPPGSSRPRKLVVVADMVDVETGERHDRFRINLDVRRERTFREIKRFGDRVPSGSLVTLTIKSKGAALPAGTEIRFCVDVAATNAALATSSSCASTGNAATFASIQAQILTPTCARAGCHDATTASANLVLEEGSSFGNLVGVTSSQVFGFDRVKPGDPEASYLIKKVRGAFDIMGVRMPVGGPFLTDGEIAGIYEWIETGARDN